MHTHHTTESRERVTAGGQRARVSGKASPRQPRNRQKSRGQAMVELALIVPIMALFLAMAADFGRAFSAYIAVSSAAREGAAFGMMSTANSSNDSGVRNAALRETPSIWGVAPTVTRTTGTDSQGFRYVQVTVNYNFSAIVSIPPIPSSINMSRTVRMRVLA